jgi:hypothetical protein
VASGRALCSCYQLGEIITREWASPDTAGVSALLRRRLGPVARVVFQVLNHCADITRQEPVVFSSVLGDINRTQTILESIVSGAPVSPAAFSLSVHNAIGGLWSLAHGITAPMVALAPLDYSPVPALVEAAGMLEEGGHFAVNVVFFEDQYPEFYAGFFEPPPGPTAIALRLVAPELESGEAGLRIELKRGGSPAQPVPESNFTALADLLAARRTAITICEPECEWLLERCA